MIPPSYLIQATERTIAAALSYLRKDTETLEMNVNLEVPLANAAMEMTGYVEECFQAGANSMAGKTSKKSTKGARTDGAKPVLLSGGNPQIPKGDGDVPV